MVIRLQLQTAGLLHALGELLIHWAHPDKVPSINTLMPPLDIRRSKLELRMLGYYYGEVSAALARRWLAGRRVVRRGVDGHRVDWRRVTGTPGPTGHGSPGQAGHGSPGLSGS